MIELDDAKQQLNIMPDDTQDDAYIKALIPAAVGMVEQHVNKVIYLTSEEAEQSLNSIALDALRETQFSALKAGVLMALSSLYLNRESQTDIAMSENPAFIACLKGFREVVVG